MSDSIYTVSIDDKTYKVKYSKNNDPEILGNSETSINTKQPNTNESEISNKEGVLVLAPLGGNIFKVEFNSGDSVDQDNPVVILEAMKMETAIKPPKSGKLGKIFVSQGDKVNPGDPLFEIV